jgi:hypothetical protein
MPIVCQHKLHHGPEFCASDCPVNAPCGIFYYDRIEKAEQQLPDPARRMIDVAVLDMNHGWPNLGHDSLVHLVQDACCDIAKDLEAHHMAVRVFSFDVRRAHALPEKPGGRFAIYAGTGGPGHLDPRLNDGVSPGSQGIREDPSWEPAIFSLFDSIHADSQAALLGVCHTFGVMCRWKGLGVPRLRGPNEGGKSTGVLENLLTSEACDHQKNMMEAAAFESWITVCSISFPRNPFKMACCRLRTKQKESAARKANPSQ